MELSVVIPTFNQAPLLEACLNSFTAQSIGYDTYEIVVVDDGSTDETPEVIVRAAAELAKIRLVRFPSNRGRSAARNAGIDAAEAPIVVLVDSDVIVRPNFLHWHFYTHRVRGPGVVCRGPVIAISDPAEANRNGFHWILGSPAYLDTANASLEKAALLRAGGFDESFPGYGWEDFELGMRVKRLGIRREFCREAIAYHVDPPMEQDSLQELLRKESERAKSAVHFLKKHPGIETKLLTQTTRAHHALYWLLSAGGSFTPSKAAEIAGWLQKRGRHRFAQATLRMALNWQYAQYLKAELSRARAT